MGSSTLDWRALIPSLVFSVKRGTTTYLFCMEKKTLSASAEKSAVPAPESAAAPEAAPAPSAPPAFDNTIHVEGILDIDVAKGGNGQLLDMAKNGKRRPTDTFVPKELIRRFKLKAGSLVGGTAFPRRAASPTRRCATSRWSTGCRSRSGAPSPTSGP